MLSGGHRDPPLQFAIHFCMIHIYNARCQERLRAIRELPLRVVVYSFTSNKLNYNLPQYKTEMPHHTCETSPIFMHIKIKVTLF